MSTKQYRIVALRQWVEALANHEQLGYKLHGVDLECLARLNASQLEAVLALLAGTYARAGFDFRAFNRSLKVAV